MAPALIRTVRYRRPRHGRRLLGPGLKAVFWLALVVAGVRAALPWAVRHRAEAALGRVDGYEGKVGEADLSVWRGLCVYRDVRLEKAGTASSPFFHAAEVRVSLDWGQLLRGPMTADLTVVQPSLNAVTEAAPPRPGLAASFMRGFAELAPVPVSRLEVREGAATYRDVSGPAPVDAALRRIELLGVGLAQSEGALISGSAEAYAAGRLRFHARVDPDAAPPVFEVEADARDVRFSESFDLLKSLAGFEAPGGALELAVEASAASGELRGHAQATFHNLYLSSWSGRKTGPLRAYREAVAAAGGQVLETAGKERIAARVPLRRALDDADVWLALARALRDGLIEALQPGALQKKEKKT